MRGNPRPQQRLRIRDRHGGMTDAQGDRAILAAVAIKYATALGMLAGAAQGLRLWLGT